MPHVEAELQWTIGILNAFNLNPPKSNSQLYIDILKPFLNKWVLAKSSTCKYCENGMVVQ